METGEGERLQKVIAAAGVSSRRGAEALIAAGEVTVNGEVAVLGRRVHPEVDVIAVSGRVISLQSGHVYMALNKPLGIVASLASTHGERTVTDLVPANRRVFPVGRLDKETTGLLLMTDDGEWADAITHPRYEVEKEYIATVRGVPGREDLQRLRTGVELPDGAITAPARVRLLEEGRGRAVLDVTVIEGKKRQIRLMLAAVGTPVVQLRRVRVGSIVLGELREGEWRYLTDDEVRSVTRGGSSRE